MTILRVVVSLLLPVAFVVGCSESKGPARYPVSGKVSFDGVPVETGSIVFRDEDRNSSVAPDGGNIEKGQYDVMVQPGPKRVEILASRPIEQPKGAVRQDRAKFEIVPVEQYIPKTYNAESELKSQVEPKSNKFDFDLKSPAGAKK